MLKHAKTPCNYHIGFCGTLTSGKSVAARASQFLLTPFYNAHVMSFAHSVKLIAKEFGWDGNKDEKGRKLLQVIGTEAGRHYDPDIWINKAVQREFDIFDESYRSSNIAIYDDLRFENEAIWIKEFSGEYGIVIKVDSDSPKDTSLTNHISEAGISDDLIDYYIKNDYNVLNLIKSIYNIFAENHFQTLSLRGQL